MKKLNVERLYNQLLKDIYNNKITEYTKENFYLIKRRGHLKKFHTFESFKQKINYQIQQIQQTKTEKLIN